MASAQGMRFFSLLQREFREYRNSLFWTPVITAGVLALLMLVSVIVVNRVSVLGDVLLDRVLEDRPGVNISISVGEEGDRHVPVVVLERDSHAMDDAVPAPPEAPDYEVIVEGEAPAEQWNFSREWRFDPNGDAGDDDAEELPYRDRVEGENLNPMLSIVHNILLLVLFITTGNYLLGTLFDDRKDRSILFWRSLPVSEWEVVLSKFVMALVVAPLIYIAISILLQLGYVLLLMLLVWRMDRDPFETVLANVDFLALLGDPIGGWVLTALWIAPLYAYLLLASSAARRSPFMMALVPFLALWIAEGVFFGSERVADAVQRHFPHATDTSAVGFYLFGPNWRGIDLLGMSAGLAFAGLALAGAVWLRRYRWEL